MKQPVILLLSIFIACFSFSSCEKDNTTSGKPKNNLTGSSFIADYSVAKESVLRSIPLEYIDKARQELHIAYQHTSHGTHVSYGLYGLQDYKTGDDFLFGITNDNPTTGKLDFHDYALSGYAAPGESAEDLSSDETGFIQATRNFLDDPANAEINVVMWSWCDIAGHSVALNYLPGMDLLIKEYGVGGIKIGAGDGQRTVPVTFIFMTGHGNAGSNIGAGNPRDQANLIIDYCEENNQLCLDYFGIDSHDMNSNFWEDAGDNGNSESYGGNFYEEWQNAHAAGVDYFENKESPYGSVVFGQHNSQHITANRKAYAMWWILARIAGWDGESTN